MPGFTGSESPSRVSPGASSRTLAQVHGRGEGGGPAGHRSQRSVPSPASGGDQRRRGLAPHAQLHMSACCAPSGCALQGAHSRLKRAPFAKPTRDQALPTCDQPHVPVRSNARSGQLTDTPVSLHMYLSACTRPRSGRVHPRPGVRTRQVTGRSRLLARQPCMQDGFSARTPCIPNASSARRACIEEPLPRTRSVHPTITTATRKAHQ